MQKNFSRTSSPADDRRCRAPVHLGFMPRLRVAWNKGARSLDPKPHLGKSHIPADGGFTPFIAMLIHQPIVYPMGRMSLLCRLVLVVFQPAVNSRHIIAQRRKRLMLPLLVAPRLPPYRLLDRVAGMTRQSCQLTDILPVNPIPRPYQFILIHLEHSFSSTVIGFTNPEPLYREDNCSGWSIFGYQYPSFLVNFRLSKPTTLNDIIKVLFS